MPPKPGPRMTANPVRPGRYRPGKVVAEVESSDEEEEAEDAAEAEDEDAEDTPAPAPTKAQPPKFSSGKQAAATASNLKNLNLEERRRKDVEREKAAKEDERRERERLERDAGFVTESEEGSDEEDEEGGAQAQPDTARRKDQAISKATGSTSEEDSDEESGSEDDSDSSDSDAKPTLKRPLFIKKTDRKPLTNNSYTTAPLQPSSSTATPAPSQPTDRDSARAKKQAQSDAMIQATLDARAAEAAAGSRAWDDEGPGELDDTDGLDPDLEHAEWVARELARVKRSRAVLEAREAEIAEVERRRALSTPEREREDAERMDEQKAARDEKAREAKDRGGEGYMRRYHHKGAFGAGDEDAEERLRERVLMTAEYEGSVKMKSALPQYLQVRDETTIGRKGRQRHRDLRTEDTGAWGLGASRGGRGGGGRGGADFGPVDDERFRPDDPRDSDGPTGANAGIIGERKRPGGYGERYDGAKRPRREEVR